MPIGARIKEERERLSLTQQELAERCGVTMRSQRNYEKDERNPDSDYIAALAEMGVDILYVITGQRGAPPRQSEATTRGRVLRPDQEALLDNYEHSDEVAKQAARRLLDPKSKRRAA